eukprot:2994613-Pyramimonas_sp.AAC.1
MATAGLHVAGDWVHESHTMNLSTKLGLWFCGICGAFASRQNIKLRKVCERATPTGEGYLKSIRL